MKEINPFYKKTFNESTFFLSALLLLIIGLSLLPFFKIGFTTADDLEFYMKTHSGNLYSYVHDYAMSTGRFYMLITKPLYHLPYLIDNFYFTKIVQYSSLLLTFILFALLVKKIFRQNQFALLIFLFLFVFLPITPNFHIPTIAYPFFFTFSFSIFLISILLLLQYMEKKKYKSLIFSALTFALALLFYENYLIFSLFIFGYIALENISEHGIKIFKSKSFYKEILPFTIIITTYLVAYFIFQRNALHGRYGGSSFVQNFSVSHFFEVLWNYNKMAFPTFSYHGGSRGIIETFSLLETGHHNNFLYMLKNSSAIVLTKTFLQCLVFIFLFLKMETIISWKKIGIGALVAILFSFSAHLLVAISEKYQADDYWRNVPGYVTTFFSYFSVTLLAGLIMYAILKLCINIKWLKIMVMAIFAITVMYVSIMIGYTNEHVSRAWQYSQNVFTTFDKALEKGIFEELPANAVMYVGDLNAPLKIFSNGISEKSFTWKDYIVLKSNKNLNVFDSFEQIEANLQENMQPTIYYLARYDTPKSQDVLLVLSKVNIHSVKQGDKEKMFSEATANEAAVYYYSPSKDFLFGFSILEYTQQSNILLNGIKHEIHSGVNVIRINNENKKEEITSFTIKSDKPFSVKDFLISNIGFVNTENQILQ